MQRLKINKLTWLIKVAVMICLATLLLKYKYLDLVLLRLSFATPSLFIPALFLLFLGIFASGIRWWLILKVSGLPVSFKTAISIQLIGSFCSIYMPGASGGDIVRGIFIYRDLKKSDGRSVALISIIADRIFAFLGLLITAGLACIYLVLNPEKGIDVSRYIELVIQIFTWGSILVLIATLFVVIIKTFKITHYLSPKLTAYLHIAQTTVVIYIDNWLCLVLCVIISVAASSTVAVGIVLIASIFPFAPEPTISAIAGVFGNLFSAIPITPGGVGVGEVIFAKICIDLMKYSAPYATIYLTFRMGMLFSNLPGGILTLASLFKKKL
jgi:glycosyltransferase 2 family protein